MANHFFDALMGAGDDHAPFLRVLGADALTYAGMRRRTARIAAALIALGVAPGDRVAAQIEKSAEGLMLYLATVRAGAIFLPLNTAYTTAELAYFLGDAEPRVVVCDPACREAVSELAEQSGIESVETLDRHGRGSLAAIVDAAADDPIIVARDHDDLAAILYTSGTTGRSKGATLTHGNLVSNAKTLAEAWRFSDRDVLLHALPIYHTHGLFVATNTVLAAGASMILLPKFEAGALITALPSATTMMGVPTFYTRLLDRADLTRDVVKHIRLFVSGSAPLLAETHQAWSDRTGHAILERYGMTETNMNCSNPYDDERRPGTVGPPLRGIEARVVDPVSGEGLGPDEVGMIEVKGPNVFKGYWRNEEKTKSEFRSDGFFITGDLGKIDADGYVHIVGRAKDMVISGGLNVYPKEIETEIDAIDGVVESAVIGVPHMDLGEGVVAIVVAERSAALDEDSVKAALTDRLARFKQPKRVIFVDELPRNSMGKVQKNVLRKTFERMFRA